MANRLAKSSLSDMKGVMQELNTAEPRSCILVGASMVEYALETVILHTLGEGKLKADIKYLFDDQNAIYSSFERKIWGAYFANIIGPRTRSDIDLIRRIRNHCAHTMKRIGFDEPPIADRCKSFGLTKGAWKKAVIGERRAHLSVVIPAIDDASSLRGRFLFVIGVIASHLLLKAAFAGSEMDKQASDLQKLFKASVDA